MQLYKAGGALVALVLAAATASAAQIKLGDRTFTLPDGFTIEQVAGPGIVDRPIVADFGRAGTALRR